MLAALRFGEFWERVVLRLFRLTPWVGLRTTRFLVGFTPLEFFPPALALGPVLGAADFLPLFAGAALVPTCKGDEGASVFCWVATSNIPAATCRRSSLRDLSGEERGRERRSRAGTLDEDAPPEPPRG